MSAASALARGRAAALRLMVDACTIRRVTGQTVDDDGNITHTYVDVYAGRCRVQQRLGQAQQADAGEDAMLLLRLEIHLPTSVLDLEVGDEVAVTASVHDPDLPARTFLVRDLAHKSHGTARRVGVIERAS